MHTIHIDRATALVDVRLAGFFSADEAMAAVADIRAAIRSLGAMAGRHLTLYDITAVDIAPGATIDAMKSAFTDPGIRSLWARRVAYCTPSALARLQIARLRVARPDIAVFDTRAKALTWLLAPDAVAA